jgi:cell division protein FtsW
MRRRHPVTLAEQVLVLATLGLVAFGLVMVYSASSATAIHAYGNSLYFLERDALYAVCGLAAMALLARLDPRVLIRVAPALLGISVALMLMVAAVGVSVNGAKRWLPVGPLTLQPSELAKLALCLFAAAVLADPRRPPAQDWRAVMRPVGAVTGALAVLAMLERDLGTAVAFVLIATAVLVASGTRAGAIGRVLGLALGLGAVAVWAEPYRRARVLAFLDPSANHAGSGYQLFQSTLAVGSGGLFGVGLGQGVAKTGYLPEAHTDLIFAIVAQELGLFGVIGLVAAFAAVAWAGFTIALRAKDPFGKRVAAGITALVVGQAAINFGGVLGLLPLTGVPVPLVSFGGSSLITTLAGVGVVLAVAAHDRVAVPAARRSERTTTAHARPRPRTRAVAAGRR